MISGNIKLHKEASPSSSYSTYSPDPSQGVPKDQRQDWLDKHLAEIAKEGFVVGAKVTRASIPFGVAGEIVRIITDADEAWKTYLSANPIVVRFPSYSWESQMTRRELMIYEDDQALYGVGCGW